MPVSERIRKVLAHERFSPKMVAKSLGVNVRTINNYIEGETPPNFKFLLWLFSEVKNLNAQWLFLGEKPMLLENIALTKNKLIEKRMEEVEKETKELRALIQELRENLVDVKDGLSGIENVLSEGLK